jgi:hypothetical protein
VSRIAFDAIVIMLLERRASTAMPKSERGIAQKIVKIASDYDLGAPLNPDSRSVRDLAGRVHAIIEQKRTRRPSRDKVVPIRPR